LRTYRRSADHRTGPNLCLSRCRPALGPTLGLAVTLAVWSAAARASTATPVSTTATATGQPAATNSGATTATTAGTTANTKPGLGGSTPAPTAPTAPTAPSPSRPPRSTTTEAEVPTTLGPEVEPPLALADLLEAADTVCTDFDTKANQLQPTSEDDAAVLAAFAQVVPLARHLLATLEAIGEPADRADDWARHLSIRSNGVDRVEVLVATPGMTSDGLVNDPTFTSLTTQSKTLGLDLGLRICEKQRS